MSFISILCFIDIHSISVLFYCPDFYSRFYFLTMTCLYIKPINVLGQKDGNSPSGIVGKAYIAEEADHVDFLFEVKLLL